MDQVRNSRPEANVLPGGDFESIAQRPEEAWRIEDPPSLDEMDLVALRVSNAPQPKETKEANAKPDPKGKKTPAEKGPPRIETVPEGKQCAMLQIKPKANRPTPQALERTLLALSSPTVKLQPGTLVQVSAWVCIPSAIAASPDGALFYDSAGGEPLAIRMTDAMPWKKFTMYRRVPANGSMQVTLALTGVGTVYFDDVRIEPLSPGGTPLLTTGATTQR
jgi:hypothetical protein